jgi:transcriptional regulator with XRE-family HTH domain
MEQNQVPHFASRLSELRGKAGLTQQQLAERAGIHKLTVAKLEQGIREPTWATVQMLADALGVNCLAFTSKASGPESTAKRPRGRPPKAASSAMPTGEREAGAKKPRGGRRKKT